MMKTVMIVGEGLGLGVQQMIHLILAPFSPHTVTILSLTFLSFAFHAVFSAFQAPLNFLGWDKMTMLVADTIEFWGGMVWQ